MRTSPTLLGLVALSCIGASSLHAASVIFNVSSGDWAVATNWSNNYIPGNSPGADATDAAFIRLGRTANVTSNVTAGTFKPVNILHIGEAAAVSTVTISGAGILSLTTTVNIMRPGDSLSGATGALSMTGGSLSTSALNIGSGSSGQTGSGSGTMNISGASTVSATAVTVGSATAAQGSGYLNINGTGASFNATTLTANAFSEFKFTLDSSSVSTLNFSGLANFLAGSRLTIDGSAYSGGGGTYTLIDAGSLTGYANITQSVTGFGPGYTTSVGLDVLTNNIVLNVTPIPEPGTYALLGLGLGLIAWRARRPRRS